MGQANKVHLFYTHNPLDKNSSLPSPCILNLQALWPEGVLEAKRVGNQIPPPPNVLAEEQELRLYLLSLPANKRTIVENSLVIKIPNLIPRKEICFSPEENGEKYIEAFLNNVPRYNNQPILTIYPLLDYAKCPRFFWYKYILRLSIFPTISEVLTGRERGTLIHNTLEKFLYPLIGVEGEKNKDLISPNNLIKIFHNQALELKKRSSVGRLPIFEETLLELQNILLLWLERQNSFKDIKIIHLEWSFNANNKFGYSPLKIEAKSGQFYLQGRCDRIDVKEDKYLIRDYKLSYTKRYEPPKKTDIGAVSNNDSNGNYPSKENISRRISHYPLLMYALAWQEYITNQNLPVKEIQCLFEFLDPNNTYQLLYSSPKEISEIALLYDLLKQGNFEPNPLENEMMCDYCEYSNICEKS
ncbi:MAG: PD-(D/E)XK nuclease family protein [Deltaproteobacteria bacterium]|nr:PD-(D/E)XK nuclease family protein [Deltaproteobacteria bacterium]